MKKFNLYQTAVKAMIVRCETANVKQRKQPFAFCHLSTIIYHLILFAISITALVSCTKEIDVKLENAEAQTVIEGTVTNASFAEVRLSKSVPFTNSNHFPAISGAVVSITDNEGTKYDLAETVPGTYSNASLMGIPGRTYHLNIVAEGKTYTASSAMPLPVTLDSLVADKIFMGSESIYVIKPVYTDPAEWGNCYRFIETINNRRYPDAWVWDDRLINDGVSGRPLVQHDSTIAVNDIVEVEMQCIDKNVFRYFNALSHLKYNATTPANPPTNISGGALGYFSAHTSQKKRIVVK